MNKSNLLVSLLHMVNRHVIKSYHCRTVLLQAPCSSYLHPFLPSSRLYCSSKTAELNIISSETSPVELSDELESTVPRSPDIRSITNGDSSLEKKLRVLFLELEVFRQEGKRVPTSLHDEQWKEVLNMTSRSARKKYLAYLWGVEIKKQAEKRKKEEKRLHKEDRYASDQVDEQDGQIHYGLNRNTIHMRIYDTTINQLYNNKLVQAIQFGQKIVVDCSYDVHMTSREALNTAKQITLLFSENRTHAEPFDLHLCNADRSGHTLSQLHRFIATLYEDHFPVNVTEKSYLDVFPRESLVYLTPHCREELTEYDHDAVYIIGAMVDKVNTQPLSLGKAKKEGLKMAKLPLERYLSWGSGSGKSLTLNQMMLIMLEMKTSGDWDKALRHVPRRKLSEDERPRGQYQARYRGENQYQARTRGDYEERNHYQTRHGTEHQIRNQYQGRDEMENQDGNQYQARSREEFQDRNQYQAKRGTENQNRNQYQAKTRRSVQERSQFQTRDHERHRSYFKEDEPLAKNNK